MIEVFTVNEPDGFYGELIHIPDCPGDILILKVNNQGSMENGYYYFPIFEYIKKPFENE